MRLLCYPDRPTPRHKLRHICRNLGWDLMSQPGRDYDAAIVWRDSTWVDDDAVLQKLRADSKPCLNVNCLDISKSRVDAMFRSVFGYGASVDPLAYHGEMVAKREENDNKDALKLVTGPLPAEQVEPGLVYQKVIDTRLDDGRIEDIRVCIFSGRPRFTVLKRRALGERFFTNLGSSVLVDSPSQIFGDDELRKIERFCAEMGLDYGELDVLRDRDGKPYIIDCNKTPGTGMVYPATEEEAPERRRAYEALFREMFGGLDCRLEVRLKTLLRRMRRQLSPKSWIGGRPRRPAVHASRRPGDGEAGPH